MRKSSENNLFWQTQIELYGRKTIPANKPVAKSEQPGLNDWKSRKALRWKRDSSFGSRSSDIDNLFETDVTSASTKETPPFNKRSQNPCALKNSNYGFRTGLSNNNRSYGNGKAGRNIARKDEMKDVYIPPVPLKGEALFEDRRKKRHMPGLNFNAYENIPVEVSGNNLLNFQVRTFKDLNLGWVVLENVTRAGFKTPTPIQKSASSYISAGRDIMACAQTGSGKTAAYLLPIVNQLHKDNLQAPSKGLQCLILAPTRELALQIEREANLYSHGTDLKCCCVCGGIAVFHQRLMLKKGCSLLVATPGRLLQFLDEKVFDMAHIKYFVLDEADRMLDLGFMGVVREILKFLPAKGKRISAMFSATFPGGVQRAASDFLKDHTFIAIGTVGGACRDVQQIVYKVDRYDKTNKLLDILREEELDGKIIIFCAKKISSMHLATALTTFGFVVTTLNGDMLQRERELALKEFSDGKYQILVTTGIASRGLDVAKVSLVINYDLPETIEEYVHRIGRTGRIGNIGKALSFFEDVVDDLLRPNLLNVLRSAEQDVPDWLAEEYDLEEKSMYGSRFPATDYRRNQNFSPWSSVPAAIERVEDGWA